MNIYFIVCVITVYFVAQIVLALAIGPLSVGSCVPLMKLKGSIVVGLFFFQHFLNFFWYYELLQAYLYVPCSSLRVLQGALFFLLENGGGTKIWA